MWIFKSNLSPEKFLSSDSEHTKEYLLQLEDEYNEYKRDTVFDLSFSHFMEYSVNGSRLAYEREYFNRRTALRDFALKAWLGDETAVELLEQVMNDVCEEFTWVLPAHLGNNIFNETIDLFAAETAQTLAEIMSLIQDKLTQKTIERCAYEIRRRVLNPFINRKKPYNWENSKSNWCAVCGGCIGMTAIYIIKSDIEAKKVIQSIVPVFEQYLMSFAEDGACLEGLYYWNYGMMYFTAFIDLYRQRFGEDFAVNKNKMKKIAEFPFKCCLGGGFIVSVSDGSERDRIYAGLLYKLREMYDAPVVPPEYLALFEGDECGRWCKAARDIAWTDIGNNTEINGQYILEEAQWAVFTNSNRAVCFKGGTNDEPHNHNDIGSIAVLKNGYMLLCDLGAGEYTADYFSDKRYNIFCNSSLGHSVPIINGKGQKTGAKYSANNFLSGEGCVSAEISGAYDDADLKSCERSVKFGEETVICDKFLFRNPAKVTERFVSRHRAEITDEGVIIIADGRIVGTLVTDKKYKTEIILHKHYEHNGTVSEIGCIDFSFEVNKDYTFLVKMI